MHDGQEASSASEEVVVRKRRKGIYILPNLFTLAALFGGEEGSQLLFQGAGVVAASCSDAHVFVLHTCEGHALSSASVDRHPMPLHGDGQSQGAWGNVRMRACVTVSSREGDVRTRSAQSEANGKQSDARRTRHVQNTSLSHPSPLCESQLSPLSCLGTVLRIGHWCELAKVQCFGLIELKFLSSVVIDDELECTIKCFDRLPCRFVHGIALP